MPLAVKSRLTVSRSNVTSPTFQSKKINNHQKKTRDVSIDIVGVGDVGVGVSIVGVGDVGVGVGIVGLIGSFQRKTQIILFRLRLRTSI